jgi:NodT family efflux transporter outer membrane factor (OMF) lipoprotein
MIEINEILPRKCWGNLRWLAVLALVAMALLGCNVGPKYSRPRVETPVAFKEMKGWKLAQPKDGVARGRWWEVFNDTNLNALESQINISNQNVKAAVAVFFEERALVKQARAQYFPTITANPSVNHSKLSSSGNVFVGSSTAATTTGSSTGAATSGSSGGSGGGTPFSTYSTPLNAAWSPDLWGEVRNTVGEFNFAAQVSAAELETVRLTNQSELAVDYFQLRAQDSLKQLLDATVAADRKALEITQTLYETGIDSAVDIALAETQLQITLAQDTSVGILRAQFEHAIAVLIGKPASTFSIPFEPLKENVPAIPFGVPSELLERVPTIAAAERSMAEANAVIGIARAAYFPTLSLTGSTGFQSSTVATLFTGPSFVWSVGGNLAETIFDAGLRAAVTAQARATYAQTVANYRQTVLIAFQSVEDNLAALRILAQELQQQEGAVNAAQRSLGLSMHLYEVGIDSYLSVITSQTTLLSNQQTLLTLRLQRMTASVQLIVSLGGGWDASDLPTPRQIISKTPLPGSVQP